MHESKQALICQTELEIAITANTTSTSMQVLLISLQRGIWRRWDPRQNCWCRRCLNPRKLSLWFAFKIKWSKSMIFFSNMHVTTIPPSLPNPSHIFRFTRRYTVSQATPTSPHPTQYITHQFMHSSLQSGRCTSFYNTLHQDYPYKSMASLRICNYIFGGTVVKKIIINSKLLLQNHFQKVCINRYKWNKVRSVSNNILPDKDGVSLYLVTQ